MKKIEPGVVCRILAGARHRHGSPFTGQLDCLAGMIFVADCVVVATDPHAQLGIYWAPQGRLVCPDGWIAVCVHEDYLEPIIDPNVVREYDERHKNTPEPILVGARLPWSPVKKTA